MARCGRPFHSRIRMVPALRSVLRCGSSDVSRTASTVPPAAKLLPGARSPSQWQKGQSGNQVGGKKGSKNKRTIIIELMEQKLGRSKISQRTRAKLVAAIAKGRLGWTRLSLETC